MSTELALTGFGALDWSVFVIGVLVVVVLVASFVWGSRRKRRESPPIPPADSPLAPDPDSWTTPDAEAPDAEAHPRQAGTRRADRGGPGAGRAS
ncbi:DUF6479 family protein [Streptacidiphilus neutrinimicus]|uniref:DUF6479 family protein n=1 Tax=Streptacidiphilus neutrinimicus TaxID=105420 RepID=UPI001F26F6AE|nr:DUF6479 family protein [Streptacidiphilus neutrinimicus]